MAQQGRQVGDERSDERERHDPRGQEGAHRAGTDRRAEHRRAASAPAVGGTRGTKTKQTTAAQRVEPGEEHERPAVRDRSTPPIPSPKPPAYPISVDASNAPLARARRSRSPEVAAATVPSATGTNAAAPNPSSSRAPAELCRAHTERDEQHGDDADDRARHQETAGGRTGRRYRARIGANTISVTACAAPTRPMSNPFGLPPARSLSRNCTATPTPDRADAQQAAGDQQGTDGARSRVAQVIIAGASPARRRPPGRSPV